MASRRRRRRRGQSTTRSCSSTPPTSVRLGRPPSPHPPVWAGWHQSIAVRAAADGSGHHPLSLHVAPYTPCSSWLLSALLSPTTSPPATTRRHRPAGRAPPDVDRRGGHGEGERHRLSLHFYCHRSEKHCLSLHFCCHCCQETNAFACTCCRTHRNPRAGPSTRTARAGRTFTARPLGQPANLCSLMMRSAS